MSNLERLAEATETWEKWKGYIWSAIPSQDWAKVEQGLDVAEDLLANGERVEWCEEHHMSTNPNSIRCLRWMELVDAALAGVRDCRIVSKLLVDPTTEEER